MIDYEIKTHRVNRIYKSPHFYILNKGLNSGKPMNAPCPNCFVITTNDHVQRDELFYLCLSLKTGRYFGFYIKGSVIPFICIADTRRVLNLALQNYEEQQWSLKVQKLKKISAYEKNLRDQLRIISELKVAMLRS